jgi:hypothetical protein
LCMCAWSVCAYLCEKVVAPCMVGRPPPVDTHPHPPHRGQIIAINQDPLGSPAARIVGGALSFPCVSGELATVQAVTCNANDPSQQWHYDAATVRQAWKAWARLLPLRAHKRVL